METRAWTVIKITLHCFSRFDACLRLFKLGHYLVSAKFASWMLDCSAVSAELSSAKKWVGALIAHIRQWIIGTEEVSVSDFCESPSGGHRSDHESRPFSIHR